jgi:hypothetical protein
MIYRIISAHHPPRLHRIELFTRWISSWCFCNFILMGLLTSGVHGCTPWCTHVGSTYTAYWSCSVAVHIAVYIKNSIYRSYELSSRRKYSYDIRFHASPSPLRKTWLVPAVQPAKLSQSTPAQHFGRFQELSCTFRTAGDAAIWHLQEVFAVSSACVICQDVVVRTVGTTHSLKRSNKKVNTGSRWL